MEILLIRHGISIMNVSGAWAGDTDVPLADEGREEARAVAPFFASLGLEGVVTTDLARSIETGAILAESLAIPVVGTVAALRERNVGAWTGLDRHEIANRFQEEYERWRTGQSREIPHAESWTALTTRTLVGIEHVRTHFETSSRLLVVTHAQVLSALCDHLGQPQMRHPNLSGHWVQASPTGLRYLDQFNPGSLNGRSLA